MATTKKDSKKTEKLVVVVGGVYETRSGGTATVVAKLLGENDWPYVTVYGDVERVIETDNLTDRGEVWAGEESPNDLIKRIK